jgi:periplasmic mercuric ion binding protein
MKFLNYLAIMGTFVFSGGVLASESACFDVKGMTCATCTLTLKVAVNKLDGIDKVTASLEKEEAVVLFDKKLLTVEAIEKQINSTGYKATAKQCKAKAS